MTQGIGQIYKRKYDPIFQIAIISQISVLNICHISQHLSPYV